MPNFGEISPKLEDTSEDTSTVEDMKAAMGMPDVADNALNKLDAEEDMENDENMEMSEKEKLALGWIEENEIKKGTKLDYSGVNAEVLGIDVSEKIISIKFYEPNEYDRDYSFEDIGNKIDFVKKLVKVKESEEN